MQPDQPTNLHQYAPAHLLIIDDNLDQLRLLVAALRGTTYRVSVATQGDQGYARALVLQPDLILLDVCMPGRSGIAVARQLKANLSTAHIPIIFLSALMDAPERLAGLQANTHASPKGTEQRLRLKITAATLLILIFYLKFCFYIIWVEYLGLGELNTSCRSARQLHRGQPTLR